MTRKHHSTTIASQSAKTKLYSRSQYNTQLCIQKLLVYQSIISVATTICTSSDHVEGQNCATKCTVTTKIDP
jgi:hypothetical protein